MKKTLLTMAALAVMAAGANATVVFSDNFSTSQGSTYTTSGAIGTSDWSVSRSGADWGARIDSNIMTLTNDASGTANAEGWVYANTSTAFGSGFEQTLSSNAGLVTWSFNMRQIRTDPAGFGTTSYGVAFVIGSTSTSVASAGNGYAVVLGNTGSTDPIRFVSFTGGLQTLGTAAGGLITATSALTDVGTAYMSLQLTYDPSNNQWQLFGRDDGASSFTDPLTGSLTLLGSVTNSTYTGVNLTSMGAYWQGSTAATQTAFFDNVTVSVVPEPTAAMLLGGAGFMLWVLRRKRVSVMS